MASNPQSDPTVIYINDLIALSQAARSLQLRTTQIRSQMSGQYLSRIKGRGMEFDESRPYQPGDDVRNIDWRVTARTGHAYTKLFREERERPVLISVDARAAMFFATQGRFKSVVAAELAALLAWTAHHQGDRIGGEIFNETNHIELRPRRGQQAVLHFLKQLSAIQSTESIDEISLQQPMQRLQRLAHPGSLVCIVSDFRGLNDAAVSALIQIARHSELLLMQVYDPLEQALPHKGQYRVRYGGQHMDIDASDARLRQRYQLQFSGRLKALKQLSHRQGIKLIQCQSNDLPLDALRQQLGMRLSRR